MRNAVMSSRSDPENRTACADTPLSLSKLSAIPPDRHVNGAEFELLG